MSTDNKDQETNNNNSSASASPALDNRSMYDLEAEMKQLSESLSKMSSSADRLQPLNASIQKLIASNPHFKPIKILVVGNARIGKSFCGNSIVLSKPFGSARSSNRVTTFVEFYPTVIKAGAGGDTDGNMYLCFVFNVPGLIETNEKNAEDNCRETALAYEVAKNLPALTLFTVSLYPSEMGNMQTHVDALAALKLKYDLNNKNTIILGNMANFDTTSIPATDDAEAKKEYDFSSNQAFEVLAKNFPAFGPESVCIVPILNKISVPSDVDPKDKKLIKQFREGAISFLLRDRLETTLKRLSHQNREQQQQQLKPVTVLNDQPLILFSAHLETVLKKQREDAAKKVEADKKEVLQETENQKKRIQEQQEAVAADQARMEKKKQEARQEYEKEKAAAKKKAEAGMWGGFWGNCLGVVVGVFCPPAGVAICASSVATATGCAIYREVKCT